MAESLQSAQDVARAPVLHPAGIRDPTPPQHRTLQPLSFALRPSRPPAPDAQLPRTGASLLASPASAAVSVTSPQRHISTP